MNFLRFASNFIKPLSILYKDEEIFKIDKFHLDNIELGRNFLVFKIFLPMPKKEEVKWEKNKNIATLKIMIIIDGKLIINKNCINENTHKELEFFEIKIEEINEKHYKIIFISNDDTFISIESSSISGIFKLELVEDWFKDAVVTSTCPQPPAS